MKSFLVKEIVEGKEGICESLLRKLPLWFGIEKAIQNYVQDVRVMPMLVAFDRELPVGFLALHFHNECTAEIHVMAVHPDFHRSGVGRLLQAAGEELLREKRFEFLTVKTISPTKENREYALTRKFYEAMGFKPVEEFKTLWGEANPCLLLIKKL